MLLATLALILIFWQWRPVPDIVWEVQNEAGVVILYGMYALGWMIVLLATFMINHFDLFGLKQVNEYLKNMHGETYVEYQKKVPMLIPFFRRGN